MKLSAGRNEGSNKRAAEPRGIIWANIRGRGDIWIENQIGFGTYPKEPTQGTRVPSYEPFIPGGNPPDPPAGGLARLGPSL